MANTSRLLYIDLLQKCLTDSIYQGDDYIKEVRDEGKDWPKRAHTMVGMKRLQNLSDCVKSVIENNVPGDLVETGVWRGGCTILMRGILKSYDVTNRTVWVCDSFQGLPKPSYKIDEGLDLYLDKNLAIPLEQVQENFRRYNLLDDQVKFVKGWFKDTLHTIPVKQIAVLRLDGDLYESTIQTLDALYSKLSKGGYCIIDDFCIAQCGQAVHDYRIKHGILDPIIKIDWGGVYWKKT